MNFNDMNMQYRERYFEKANTTNLEKYVLSEIYNPICDYENATKIIRNAKSEIVSKNLMFLEIYICYTQLFCKSVFVEKLDHIYNDLEDSEKAILFYLKAWAPQILMKKINYWTIQFHWRLLLQIYWTK